MKVELFCFLILAKGDEWDESLIMPKQYITKRDV